MVVAVPVGVHAHGGVRREVLSGGFVELRFAGFIDRRWLRCVAVGRDVVTDLAPQVVAFGRDRAGLVEVRGRFVVVSGVERRAGGFGVPGCFGAALRQGPGVFRGGGVGLAGEQIGVGFDVVGQPRPFRPTGVGEVAFHDVAGGAVRAGGR